MKLVSINIELDRHHEAVLDFIKKENPDVVCLQEVLEKDFSKFKNEIGMEGMFQAWSYVKDTKNYPDLVGNKQGLAMFSKKIKTSGTCFYEGNKENLEKTFEEYMSSEIFNKNKAFVWIDTEDENGKIFRFINTQLPTTHMGEVSEYQLEVIDSMMKKLESFGEFVLCGDMNAPRGVESFSRISRVYKDNIPEKFITSIDPKLHRVKNLINMVDGLFTTPAYEASDVILAEGVSDHQAIVGEIKKN